MLGNYFDKKFEVGFFEVNKFEEASPLTVLKFLEETAAEHCYAIEHNLFDLIKQNIGWVLVSGIMKMYRYPRYKERIIIRTWLSNYSAVRGVRENIIYDESENIIGKARGLWVFYDIIRKRPVRIFDDIKNKWSYHNETCINNDINEKIAAIDSVDNKKELTISQSDVDMNEHVSNLKYLNWVLESIPSEVTNNYYLHEIDGRFISEAQFGDQLYSFTEKQNTGNAFAHTIKTHHNKVCATGKTLWNKRIA